MKNQLLSLGSLASAVVLAFVSSASGANVVLNSGMESGTGPDADSWNEIEVAGGTQGASSVVDRVMSDSNSGDYSISLTIAGAPDFGPVAEIQQQTLVGSVTGGETYDFSFFAKGNAGPGTVAFYEVSWFDGDGSNGGGPQGSATGLQTFSLGAGYAEQGMPDLVAPAAADSVFIAIRVVTGAFDGAAGNAFIDDVSFESQAIPEPSSIGLLALGVCLPLLRRRR